MYNKQEIENNIALYEEQIRFNQNALKKLFDNANHFLNVDLKKGDIEFLHFSFNGDLAEIQRLNMQIAKSIVALNMWKSMLN